MAGTIIVSDIKTDTDNSFVVRANTGNVLFRVTDTGLDTANSIASGSITSDMIADGTVIAADVADGSITTAKIADGNVTAAKIDTVANTQVTGTMTTAQVADEAITVSKLATTVASALGVRNLIINGDMQIAQRGTSATGVTSAGYRTVDRWQNYIESFGTWSESQDTDVPLGQGFVSSLKLNCTTTGSITTNNIHFITQKIEAQNLQHLKYGTANAEQLTLSFWVKSNKTGNYVVWFHSPDGARMTNKTYTISTADTWEKKTLTISGDTSGTINNDNGEGIRVRFILASGTDYTSGSSLDGTWASFSSSSAYAGQTVNLADSTSNYINITGVQLEVGDTATPFEHRPYDMELARCQRYYFASDTGEIKVRYKNAATALTNYRAMPIPFPVTMRDAPTVTPNATFLGNATSFSAFQSTTKSVTFGWAESGGGTTVTIDADYVCSSEL